MKLSQLLEAKSTAPRVETGIEAQQMFIEYLKKTYGDDFKLISTAGKSQKDPDVVAEIQGHRIQFEVKNRDNPAGTVKLYEKSLAANTKNVMFDVFARAYSDGKARNFTQLVELMREQDTKYGWPGMEGVEAKSGRFYIRTDNTKVRSNLRRQLVTMMNQSGDDYFVIIDRNTGEPHIYDIGSGDDVIQAAKMPSIKNVIVDSYGSGHLSKKTGQYAARLAIKAVFSK